jgi:hypothetical protein
LIWFIRFSRFTRHGLWETDGITRLLKMFQGKIEA